MEAGSREVGEEGGTSQQVVSTAVSSQDSTGDQSVMSMRIAGTQAHHAWADPLHLSRCQVGLLMSHHQSPPRQCQHWIW